MSPVELIPDTKYVLPKYAYVVSAPFKSYTSNIYCKKNLHNAILGFNSDYMNLHNTCIPTLQSFSQGTNQVISVNKS